MLRSLDQALSNPSSPYEPAVDDQGERWENTTLAGFLEAMDAWLRDSGWTLHDRRDSAVWAAILVSGDEFIGDKDDLRRYLMDLLDWASTPGLPAEQDWRPAAEALRAGRAYE
jgi:hypothetical protein